MAERQELKKYPLEVMWCSKCTHLQLSVGVDPGEMFSDYKYVSGTTKTLEQNFEDLVTYSVTPNTGLKYKELNYFPVNRDLFVVDIGGNDGSLLNKFKEIGLNILLNVDPAENLAHLSTEKGIPVKTMFWNSDTCYNIDGEPALIFAQNVFGHNSNPYDFMLGCKRVLKLGGHLIVEFPWAKNIIQSNSFDLFYHEHVNEFSVKSFAALAERVGFAIVDVMELPHIHGGSIRFKCKTSMGPHCQKVRELIRQENIVGLSELETYKNFGQTTMDNILKFFNLIKAYHDQGYGIECYGASAKSSVILNNYSNLARAYVDYILDDNELKCNLFSPGSISILHSSYLSSESRKMVHILTAWNYKDSIVKKIRELRPGAIDDLVLGYVPSVQVEKLYGE
jgi:SAM-dependent methyltransferase